MADAAKIILTEGDAPSSVAAGTLDVYGKTDDKVYKKNSAGVEEMLLSGVTPALGVPTLGTLSTQNPPVDADLFIFRASAAAWALVTSTGTQIKAYLKTYFDTLYDAAGAAAGKIASSISNGDTTHAPDGNSVFNALALKAPLTSPALVTPALGTPTSGVMTNTTTATATDNDATTKLASTAFAKSQDAVLARDPDQGVALTAAAIAAMKITHDAKYSSTTNNAGYGGVFACPSWTPAATQVLLNKWAANVGYKLELILTSGIFRLTLNATVYDSTVPGGDAASNLLAGSHHSILAAPTVGASTTTVTFLLDGVLLNTTAAQNNVDVTNTQDLYVGGTSAVTYTMTVYDVYHLNLAPTATEWRLAYLEAIPERWKWGGQTELMVAGTGNRELNFSVDTANSTEFNAAYDWTATGVSSIAVTSGVLSMITSSSSGGIFSPGNITVAGKKSRFTVNITAITGLWSIRDAAGSASISDIIATTGLQNIEYIPFDGYIRFYGITGATISIDAGTVNNSCKQLGATLALAPESWQTDKPHDLSSNNLTAAYPATGWSLTRPNAKKLWQPTPTAETTAVTLTIAKLLTGIITATHTAGATQAYTLSTGALCDAWPAFGMDRFFDWTLINLSAAAADTVTVTAAATGHTIVGNPIVQSAHATTGGIYGNSAMFRTRKTAAGVFVTYRIS